jgi:integrase
LFRDVAVKFLLENQLREMTLFAINTGCRDGEICALRWEWEVRVPIPEIGSVFVVPGDRVKNGEDRLVILNHTARAVIDRQRGKHPEFVFIFKGKPILRMLNNRCRKARKLAGLAVRVHDLKHTFGRRLRSTGVSFEDRQDLLVHKSTRITTHYSSAELINLWEAANKVCESRVGPALTLLRHVKTDPKKVGHEKVAKPVLCMVVNNG